MVDYIGLIYRNLAHVGPKKMDHPLKILSFIFSLFFLICFTAEMIFGYYQANSLYLKDKGNMTPTEKDLRDVYYEGLDKESIEKSWWVRNFNVIF